MNKNSWLIFFGVALILRFALLFIDYSWDVNNHITWAEDLIRHGFSEAFFSTVSTKAFGSLYPNYPPLSLYLFYLLYPLQAGVHAVVWWLNTTIPVFPSNLIFFIETKTFLAGIYKLPSIITDFGVSWLLYLFARRIKKKEPETLLRFLAIAFLLNPIVFYNSAFWGQIDTIPIFFALAAVYLALYTNKLLISMLLFTAGLLIKPNTVVYIPVYLYILLKNYSVRSLTMGVLAGAILFYVSYIPFNSNLPDVTAPYRLYYEKVLQAQSLSSVSNSALNFWTLILPSPGIPDTDLVAGIVSYRVLGYLLFFFFSGVTMWNLSKSKDNDGIISALFFTSFAGFLLLTKMHERYVILYLPFLVLLAWKDKRYISWLIFLTVLGFLNMYKNWPVPRIEALVDILNFDIIVRGISAGHVGTFLYLLYRWLKSYPVASAFLPKSSKNKPSGPKVKIVS